VVEVVRLEEEEAAERLLRLHERPVRRQGLAVPDADRRRGVGRLELAAAVDARRLGHGHVLAEDGLLVVLAQALELPALRIDEQRVLHGPSFACCRTTTNGRTRN